MSTKFFTNQGNISLITTEVLAEGIKLHRSNLIVNYDVPWNATRLMQRIGRVNRIGSRAEQIYVYNFYPSAHAKSINDYFIGNSRLLKEPVKFVDQLFVDVLDRYDLSSTVDDGNKESKSHDGIVNPKIVLTQSFI